MVLQQALLTILVCPVDKGSLLYFADEDLLYNPRLRRAYRIERGIPVMLAERAEPVQEDEHERLIARARNGAARMSAEGLARGGFAQDAAGIPYPATASGGIAGPASDGSRSPA
ncbi:MAG TPA: Trm112 family protein [Streptosporangiaceae bacterium]